MTPSSPIVIWSLQPGPELNFQIKTNHKHKQADRSSISEPGEDNLFFTHVQAINYKMNGFALLLDYFSNIVFA
jgi:hypothetical protein